MIELPGIRQLIKSDHHTACIKKAGNKNQPFLIIQ